MLNQYTNSTPKNCKCRREFVPYATYKSESIDTRKTISDAILII